MSLSKSTFAPRRVVALLALVGFACASSGRSDHGAASADTDGVDCSALHACGDQLRCSGGAKCFKLKSCPGFVCASMKLACSAECGGADCLVLESQPMMMSCR
ncbi:MAG TPA: hypothetical protein VGP93_02265 [Polyangiaceae bacterium]|nr:hypothetical protein [Polyangiaceae bacterium]